MAVAQTDSTDGTDDSLLADDRLEEVRAFPWLPGVGTGAGAWVLGYLLTAALFYVGPTAIQAPTETIRLKQIGIVFFNSQFVDGLVSAPPEALVAGGSRINLVLDAPATAIPIPVYFAIPIVTLLAVAGVFGAAVLGETDDPTDAGLAGVAMALGYVAVAVVMSFVVVLSTGNGVATFAPDRLQTVGFGFAYAFLFGTLGTFVGTRFER